MKKQILLAAVIACITFVNTGCSTSNSSTAETNQSTQDNQTTETSDVSLEDIYSEIAEKTELSDDMLEIGESELTSLYGIDISQVKQYAGSITMVSTSSDEIIMLEATDSDAAAAIKEKVDSRYEAKLNEMRDYLPEEFDKISDCSVYSSGNFVAMFISDNSAQMTEIFKAALN